jgi:hypothetical protein
VLFEEKATLGTIVVDRGGRIYAVGNKCEPIIVTSDEAPARRRAARAAASICSVARRRTSSTPAPVTPRRRRRGSIGYYGGNDDTTAPGVLRYVRVEFAGKEITPNNELNSFTFCGAGKNTHADYLEAFRGADDCFEWFRRHDGLQAPDRHRRDGRRLRLAVGTRNRAQFVIIRCSPNFAPSGTQNGDKGIEADNAEPPVDFDQVRCSGRSNTRIANMTIVGDRRFDDGSVFPGPTSGINWRRGTAGTLLNSIVYNMKTAALKIDDDATFRRTVSRRRRRPRCSAAAR